jgi:type I restriction enzyme S subunit
MLKTVRIKDLGKVVTGTTPPTKEPDNFGQGYPFIKPPDLSEEGRRVFHTGTEISEKGRTGQTDKLLPTNTTCVVCIGTIGKLGLTSRPSFSNQQINSVIPDTRLFDPIFVYYLMRAIIPKVKKLNAGSASGRENVNKSSFENIEVEAPTLPVQRRIAGILSAYDDLIENNARRIKILEDMARTLYREWFVEFRFPGHEKVKFVDSPLGKIPEGWKPSTLGSESEVVMGQSPKSKFYNENGDGLPFHQGVTHFGRYFPTHMKFCTVESRVAQAGDTLVSVRAPVGRINVADTRLVIGRGLAAVRPINQAPGFHYWQLREAFREEDSMGGGTIFKAITKGDLLSLPWLIPDSQIVDRFERLERPTFELLANLSQKIRGLRTSRDLLLPRLLSGQIDVSEIEKVQETAA